MIEKLIFIVGFCFVPVFIGLACLFPKTILTVCLTIITLLASFLFGSTLQSVYDFLKMNRRMR